MMSPSFGMLVTSSSAHSRRSRRHQRSSRHRESRNNTSDNSGSPGQETRDMPLQGSQQQQQLPQQPVPQKSLCVANIFKRSQNEKIGLNLKLSSTMGRIYVSDIKRNSKFADTPLQIGMVVLTVNAKPCPRTVKETAALIKGIEGDLTIVACSLKNTQGSARSTSATASATADSRESRRFRLRNQKPSRHEDEEVRRRRLSECLAPAEFVASPSFSENSAMIIADEEGVETALLDTSGETEAKEYHDGAEDGDADDDMSSGNPFADLEVSENEDWNENTLHKSNRAGGLSRGNSRKNDDKPRYITTKRPTSGFHKSVPAAASATAAMTSKAVRTSNAKRAASDSYAFSKATKAATKQAESDVSAKGYESESSFFSLPSHEQVKSFTKAATSWLLGEEAPGAKDAGLHDHEFDAAYDTDYSRTRNRSNFSSQSGGGNCNLRTDKAGASTSQQKEQFHQYPPPSPSQYRTMASNDNDQPPLPQPLLQRQSDRQPEFFMTPGAYSIPGPGSFTRSSSRASSTDRASSAHESDDSSFLRSFYDAGDFSDFDDDTDLEWGGGNDQDGNGDRVENMLDSLLDNNADLGSDHTEEDESLRRSSQSSSLVVAAELTTDAEAQIEDRVRRSILQDTAVASVVMVEHGGSSYRGKHGPTSRNNSNGRRYKPKDVKEKLFGDGKKNSMEVILSGLEASPDDYIQKRDLLPWTVKRNTTTNLWVASVQTNQKAWEQASSDHERSLEQVRSCHTFSGATETEAYEAGLAMAPPVMHPFAENPTCFLCKAKFAVFQRPKHCKNCGVVICSTCCCSWSSKRLPDTYRKKNSSGTVLVCLACDWLATNFQQALLRGNVPKAQALYKTGNINLRTPYGPYNGGRSKKRRDEIMYPIHMGILGGNLALVRWLVQDRFVPLKRSAPLASTGSSSNSKRFDDSLVLRTSKGRSPLRLALAQEHVDILKFLVSSQKLDLSEEDLRMDYRKVLRHLTVLLDTIPAPMLAHQRNRDNTMPASAESVRGRAGKAGNTGHNDVIIDHAASGDSIAPPGNHLFS